MARPLEYQVPSDLIPKMAFVPDDQKKLSHTQREMFMVSDLAKSGLEYGDISAKPCSGGYMIPYAGLDGKPVLDGLGRIAMYRIRLVLPDKDGGKYRQPSKNEIGDLASIPYIPPATFDLDGDTLLICEGEKKSACAAKYLKKKAIAIGGCHSWQVKGEIHPVILGLIRAWGIKEIILVPDGDVRRYDIASAYGTFRQKLQIEGYDAKIADIPRGVKLDDLLWEQENPEAWFSGLGTFTDLVEDPVKIAQDYGLTLKARGKGFEVPPNESNLYSLLRRHPAFPEFWFDSDKKLIKQESEVLQEGRHDFDVLATFQHRFQLHSARMGTAISAVARAAFENEKSPFLEWVDGQVWDGEERLDSWLIDYCGAEDSAYTRQLGRRWLVGAVARMRDPGCIVDYMLITKGIQGIGKSSLPTILFGADNVVAIEGQEGQHKDLLAKMHLGLCANMEELSIMRGKEISALKPTITNRIDAFRRPFRRDTVQEPRRFVIYGSTDKQFALPNDPAGHRRFPIVEINFVLFQDLEKDRGQLWAEAALAYERGEEYSNIDDVTEQVRQYVQEDPLIEAFEDLISEIVRNGSSDYLGIFRSQKVIAMSAGEIQDVMGMPASTGRGWAGNVIKEHMVNTGWELVSRGPSRRNGPGARKAWVKVIATVATD